VKIGQKDNKIVSTRFTFSERKESDKDVDTSKKI